MKYLFEQPKIKSTKIIQLNLIIPSASLSEHFPLFPSCSNLCFVQQPLTLSQITSAFHFHRNFSLPHQFIFVGKTCYFSRLCCNLWHNNKVGELYWNLVIDIWKSTVPSLKVYLPWNCKKTRALMPEPSYAIIHQFTSCVEHFQILCILSIFTL